MLTEGIKMDGNSKMFEVELMALKEEKMEIRNSQLKALTAI